MGKRGRVNYKGCAPESLNSREGVLPRQVPRPRKKRGVLLRDVTSARAMYLKTVISLGLIGS